MVEYECENKDGRTEWKMRRIANRLEKVLWGIVLLGGAAALILGKLGYLDGMFREVSVWTVLWSVVLIGVFIDGICKRSFGLMAFAVAFFVIVNDEWLGLTAITPWPVLGAALLVTIALNILFPRTKTFKKWKGGHPKNRSVNEETVNGDFVGYENCFGSAVKYVSGEVATVNVESSFGAMEVFFSGATLKGNSAQVHVEASFGEVKLNVPAAWRVVINIDNSFGGVDEEGHCNPNGENVLYVSGEVSFGHLKIVYM